MSHLSTWSANDAVAGRRRRARDEPGAVRSSPRGGGGGGDGSSWCPPSGGGSSAAPSTGRLIFPFSSRAIGGHQPEVAPWTVG